MVTVEAVERALQPLRVHAVREEWALQADIAALLQAAGLPFRRECPLAPGCRIDFLAGGVGIEVKRGRPAAKPLREQVTRYARCPEVEALLVVVEGKAFLPARVGGKPCRVLSLSRNWGVELP